MKPDAPRAEGIPIDYCYGDGVVLDLTHKRAGEEITPGDIDEAERKLDGYRIKALDIVFVWGRRAFLQAKSVAPKRRSREGGLVPVPQFFPSIPVSTPTPHFCNLDLQGATLRRLRWLHYRSNVVLTSKHSRLIRSGTPPDVE